MKMSTVNVVLCVRTTIFMNVEDLLMNIRPRTTLRRTRLIKRMALAGRAQPNEGMLSMELIAPLGSLYPNNCHKSPPSAR